MANLTQFALNVNLSGSVANPVNSLSFQVVAPWGQSSKRSSLREALEDITNRCGTEQAGVMGNYFRAQVLNGATGSGATGYTSANEVGIP